GVQRCALPISLERTGRLGRDALHVLDGGRIAGVVTYRDLAAAAKGGGTVRDALIGDYPQAQRGTHLYRLFRMCAGGLPVAVLDDSGALVGVAEPGAVFAQLSSEDEGGNGASVGPKVRPAA